MEQCTLCMKCILRLLLRPVCSKRHVKERPSLTVPQPSADAEPAPGSTATRFRRMVEAAKVEVLDHQNLAKASNSATFITGATRVHTVATLATLSKQASHPARIIDGRQHLRGHPDRCGNSGPVVHNLGLAQGKTQTFFPWEPVHSCVYPTAKHRFWLHEVLRAEACPTNPTKSPLSASPPEAQSSG